MPVSDDKKPVLSPAMVQFLRRRVMEISGLALILVGVALLLALASAGSQEPSFNRVSNAPVVNYSEWLAPIYRHCCLAGLVFRHFYWHSPRYSGGLIFCANNHQRGLNGGCYYGR